MNKDYLVYVSQTLYIWVGVNWAVLSVEHRKSSVSDLVFFAYKHNLSPCSIRSVER